VSQHTISQTVGLEGLVFVVQHSCGATHNQTDSGVEGLVSTCTSALFVSVCLDQEQA